MVSEGEQRVDVAGERTKRLTYTTGLILMWNIPVHVLCRTLSRVGRHTLACMRPACRQDLVCCGRDRVIIIGRVWKVASPPTPVQMLVKLGKRQYGWGQTLNEYDLSHCV